MSVVDHVPAISRGNRLPEPEIHDVLRNERRRAALQCLRERAGEAHINELTNAIVHREAGPETDTKSLKQSVYSSLHQTHIPKLEAADVVAYDEDANVVRLTTNSREVDRYFRLRPAHGISWGEYYQLFAVTSLLVTLLVEIEVGVFAAIDPLPVLTLALVVLALSVGYQLWTRRWIYVRSLFS
ncbi:hypothetical protein RH831_09155 [Halodesulfurarchaeum sp. HSR-GB]|uniref:DUF7344 domain-containing protein n=1 Tax=Halodesulfurarchaeum sp. HSR-GB TaxID=3074077 RepID=UPI002854DDBB|nr:hypothetical protein [Halodesulfurarchaeum sp. HSR-GB]MDR5657347.1 hypothetical protein [Halodesulfurarchaeum sp. HSR-GB]